MSSVWVARGGHLFLPPLASHDICQVSQLLCAMQKEIGDPRSLQAEVLSVDSGPGGSRQDVFYAESGEVSFV